MSDRILVRTSERGWFRTVAAAYNERQPIQIIDDANVGIDPAGQTLFEMGLRGRLSVGEWTAALVGMGMGALGVGVIILAVLDPEPTSKLGLLVAGGLTLAMTGGGAAIAVLSKRKPPKVTVNGRGFTLDWA